MATKETTKKKTSSEKTKLHDFIEIDYTAKIKETNQVFDLTEEKTAKELKIYDPKTTYKPLIICLGEKLVIPGLDEFLVDKNIKELLRVEIPKEKAFGSINQKLMKIIPLAKFKNEKITPFPGLQVNIDNNFGIVRSVTSGRVIVDFNHPLAGRTLIYNVIINRIITDTKEKVDSILSILGIPLKTEIKDSKLIIENLPEPIQGLIKEKIISLIPSIKEVQFTNSKTTNKE